MTTSNDTEAHMKQIDYRKTADSLLYLLRISVMLNIVLSLLVVSLLLFY